MIVEWPLTKKSSTGQRQPVTTPTNQFIWLAALAEAEQEMPQEVQDLRSKINNCRNWRKEYSDIVFEFVKIQTQVSRSTLLTMCKAGLEAARTSFVVRQGETDDGNDQDGTTASSISDVFSKSLQEVLGSTKAMETTTVRGSNTDQGEGPYQYRLASPHGSDDEPVWIQGKQAIRQLGAFVNYGCMEQSAMDHAQNVFLNSDVSTLVRDKVFVLLGVTSELGPVYPLLRIPHAHVMGVARNGPKMDRLKEYVRQECPSTATLQVPADGVDLLTQAPQIAQWILETSPKDKTIVIFPLAYMDGEANVRATVAMDAIVQKILDERGEKSAPVQLCYYTSPATAYPIPKQAVIASQYLYESQGLSWSQMLNIASFGTIMKPTALWAQLDDPLVVFNGIANFQGPNYCLAKTMQQWRSMVAYAEGIVVAAPHAPPSRTYSVQHSPQAAAALEGMALMEPLVSFGAKTCSTLMCAIVLDQLSQGLSYGDDDGENIHPFQLFWDGAVHGGNWRYPYVLDQGAMGVAYVLGRISSLTKSSSAGRWPQGAVAPLD